MVKSYSKGQTLIPIVSFIYTNPNQGEDLGDDESGVSQF